MTALRQVRSGRMTGESGSFSWKCGSFAALKMTAIEGIVGRSGKMTIHLPKKSPQTGYFQVKAGHPGHGGSRRVVR
jgi:hypothetical protein